AVPDVYFARVSDADADYSLVVIRDADFDTESNNDLAPDAQDITLTGTVLGTIDGDIAPPTMPITFAAFGDYGSGDQYEEYVADMVKGWNPDFIITTGDNNYGDVGVGDPDWASNTGDFYGSFIKETSDDRYPEQTSPVQRFFPSVGNHDGYPLSVSAGTGGSIDGYVDYFHDDPAGGRLPDGVHTTLSSYYDFQWGPIHLFAVDSCSSLDAQQDWLRDGLANSTSDWKFVYFHHPPFSSGHGSNVAMQWPFQQWGADAVFSGHDHTYERIILDGMPYFITGLGGRSRYGFVNPIAGSEVRYSDNFGSMRVTVDGGLATFEFLSIDDGADGANGGSVIDTFTIDKSPPYVPDAVDHYSVEVNAGDVLTIETFTPADGPFQFVNNLDPVIELYDPTGMLLTSDDNSGPDGRNALLKHTAASTGSYTVRVLAAGETAGEYVLSVDGATGEKPTTETNPFQRLRPLGGLSFASRDNSGLINFAKEEEAFHFSAEGGQVISAVVTPGDPNVILSMSLDGGPAFDAPGPGEPVVLQSQEIGSSGTHTVQVSGDGTSTFVLDIYGNTLLEAEVGDSTDGNELAIDDSFIPLGSGRYSVVGTSRPETVNTVVRGVQSATVAVYDDLLVPDVDEYTLDLTGKAGRPIDLVLAGQDGADFSGEVLQLLDTDGTTVLATAVADPLGVPAINHDLAILDFIVPADGVYTLRLTAAIDGLYGIVVTDSIVFDSEPNNLSAEDPLRSLNGASVALGYLGGTESLTNGGFETGDFTGWTATSNGVPELTPWTVGAAGSGFFFNSSPLDGTYSAYNGFDGEAGLQYELYQDVTISGGSGTVLTTNHRIVYSGSGTGAQDRVFEISVRDTGNNVLETLYTENIPPDLASETDLGWNKQFFDLSAYAGRTVRIHFSEIVPETYAGPMMIEFDDISLEDDTVDWYEITLTAGNAITVFTRTPLDHPDQPSPNELDPALWVYDPAGVLIASNSDSAADGRNARLDLVAAEAGTYRIRISAESGHGEYLLRVDGPARVLDRKIFYNSSKWDENDAASNVADDMAIATDKQALLPGQSATWLNYTNYDKGINGVMIDVAGLADPTNLSAAEDFAFAVGNDDASGTWTAAAQPHTLTVRPGAGVYGSDRVTIIWTDNVIEKQWLQVTVKATENTGLAEADVFYFGNAPGEAGNNDANTIVNATDEIAARNFQHSAVDKALIDDPYDYSRDGLVDGTDQIIARNNQTNPLTMLRLITAPAVVEKAFEQVSDDLEIAAASLDWLWEFERISRSKRSSGKDTQIEQTVDMLLATLG
ncbi:hypothetical protein LCGC14_1384290, partial [marine sediment metagenome]